MSGPPLEPSDGSALAGLLGRWREPGIYRWAEDHAVNAEVDAVRWAAERAHWGFAHLDGWPLDSKAGVLAALGEALDFPEHYGRNLDAMADCLADLPDTVLLWDGWASLARADEPGLTAVLRVLADRCDDVRRPRFAVLLRGDGPDEALLPVVTPLH